MNFIDLQRLRPSEYGPGHAAENSAAVLSGRETARAHETNRGYQALKRARVLLPCEALHQVHHGALHLVLRDARERAQQAQRIRGVEETEDRARIARSDTAVGRAEEKR